MVTGKLGSHLHNLITIYSFCNQIRSDLDDKLNSIKALEENMTFYKEKKNKDFAMVTQKLASVQKFEQDAREKVAYYENLSETLAASIETLKEDITTKNAEIKEMESKLDDNTRTMKVCQYNPPFRPFLFCLLPQLNF